ncbi:uncharacterized protein [Venturia canescens]|nr:uncharacterized protein LOC122413617 isoform X2 [Venturia canescens]
MFENGSLLRRRKRFKLHKPDKELLKSELQALASSMPPPHSSEPTGSGCSSASSGGSTGGLSAANLQRLREDLLRWEMQERRMMVAAASTASPSFPMDGGVPGTEGTPGYYLLSPEARQRLTGTLADGGDASASPYEVAALLQTSGWAFSGLNSSAYMTHLPYLQSSSVRQSAALLAAELPESPVSAHLCNRRNSPSTSLSLRERGDHRHERSRLVDNENNRSLLAVRCSPSEINAEAFRDSLLYEAHPYPERLSGEDESISGNSSRNDVIYRDSSSPAASISPILTKPYGPADSLYRPTSSPRSSPNYGDPSDLRNSSESSCNSSSAALQLTIGSRIGKRTKKPFTIENIIAPDEETANPRNLEHRQLLRAPTAAKTTAAILQMPRPMYAGYPLPITGSGIHRPPYGAAT